ncbi:putative Thiamine biosynthesis lipoprotein (apbE-like) [Bradyrhizobium sp. ORS 285]|uniref:FAD:protein FMN transferase n=1 Tax=Bradyrhizobium sp. ORS 285 TaxID=115808 RepID=UPI00024073C4|nr:FAD:protein FMN transferase [Bradyrhizobium sp. ORS 285]CCD89617.1 putative THIAMINE BIOSYNTHESIS LIPOPROTEIN APBE TRANSMEMBRANE [Bradyrhizobium sp. ORS 285]SMX56296.1 putative Thiamine biosynthesis lipoprotein (apbE-like) [Bradyrhizobium sp. ORS 285]
MPATSANLRRARPLLGTFVEISLDEAPAHDVDEVIEAAFSAVADVHRLMSFFDPDSDVSRLNRDAFTRPVMVHPWTYAVLKTAVEMARLSDGAFDIGVAGLPQPSDGSPPKAGSAVELLADHHVRFNHAGLKIDLGGIAKGFAVDCAVEALQRCGVRSALVNAGGDLAAFGSRVQIIDIRDPRAPDRILCQRAVRNTAMASSARRFDPFSSVDTTETAVVDPATGLPARDIHGATVCAPTCIVADALTKIVMITGERADGLLAQCQASAMLVAADGDILTTPDWQGDLQHAA